MPVAHGDEALRVEAPAAPPPAPPPVAGSVQQRRLAAQQRVVGRGRRRAGRVRSTRASSGRTKNGTRRIAGSREQVEQERPDRLRPVGSAEVEQDDRNLSAGTHQLHQRAPRVRVGVCGTMPWPRLKMTGAPASPPGLRRFRPPTPHRPRPAPADRDCPARPPVPATLPPPRRYRLPRYRADTHPTPVRRILPDHAYPPAEESR